MLIRRILRQIAATIREWLFGTVPTPGKLTFRIGRQIVAHEVFVQITGDRTDVVRGVLTADSTVAGEPRHVQYNIAADATESPALYGSEETEVSATLYWIDNVGNVGEPRSGLIMISDTTPPPQPGDLGFRMGQEIPDDQVPPAVVEEPPTA